MPYVTTQYDNKLLVKGVDDVKEFVKYNPDWQAYHGELMIGTYVCINGEWLKYAPST